MCAMYRDTDKANTFAHHQNVLTLISKQNVINSSFNFNLVLSQGLGGQHEGQGHGKKCYLIWLKWMIDVWLHLPLFLSLTFSPNSTKSYCSNTKKYSSKVSPTGTAEEEQKNQPKVLEGGGGEENCGGWMAAVFYCGLWNRKQSIIH